MKLAGMSLKKEISPIFLFTMQVIVSPSLKLNDFTLLFISYVMCDHEPAFELIK